MPAQLASSAPHAKHKPPRDAMPHGDGPRGGLAHGTGMADSRFPELARSHWMPMLGRSNNARPTTNSLWAQTARQPSTSWPMQMSAAERSLSGGPLEGPSGYIGMHTIQRHTARQVVDAARPMGTSFLPQPPPQPPRRARRVETEAERAERRARRHAEDEALLKEFATTSGGAFPSWRNDALPIDNRAAKRRDATTDFREMSLMSTGRIINFGGKRIVPGREMD